MHKIRLAPLCGVTGYIYRTICYGMGCELAYTEMISAMGYLCAPDQPATRELMIRGRTNRGWSSSCSAGIRRLWRKLPGGLKAWESTTGST